MNTPYFLGLDGGGTGCRARLVDSEGVVLAEGTSNGKAGSLSLGLSSALEAIEQTVDSVFEQARFGVAEKARTMAVFGVAGVEHAEVQQALMATPFAFQLKAVVSDAYSACMGAHKGADGGVLIIGTGTHGFARIKGLKHRFGGWGFALADAGSGAILGRRAIRLALLAHEGIESQGGLSQEVMQQFDGQPVRMLKWSNTAKPKDYARFAPLAIYHAGEGDIRAANLVATTVDEIEKMLDRLVTVGCEKISLMGGLAKIFRSWLPDRFGSILVEPEADAMTGAIILAREFVSTPPTT